MRAAGRPRKFDGPRRVVTLTLPEQTIDQLARIDADRAKAIVLATEFALNAENVEPHVKLITVAPNVGMITVPPCPPLADVPGLSLAQILPNRFLLVLAAGTSFSDVEIAVGDLVERIVDAGSQERQILEQLLMHFRALRRSDRVNMAEVILVEGGADGP
jgi:hypothetical protein